MTRVILIKEEKHMKNKHITPLIIATTLALLLLTPLASAQNDNAPNLGVTDLSGTYAEFTYAHILEMPKTIVNADLYCDGALATYGDWGGVLLGYLLTQAQITPPEVGSIQFVASDGYQTALPINIAIDLIIAYERNGQPLAEGLRLIVPDGFLPVRLRATLLLVHQPISQSYLRP